MSSDSKNRLSGIIDKYPTGPLNEKYLGPVQHLIATTSDWLGDWYSSVKANDKKKKITMAEKTIFECTTENYEAIHKFKDIISNSEACVPKPTDVLTCVQKPPILIQKDDIVESDFEENPVKHPSRQTAAREIHISEKTEENDRDGGTGNTYYREVF
ncbi:unnamed protein product [Mytilus edulis]|uniref:Uncharacterized protein n=1 Tax=Mytilus edulis TaxID=6550 RepID=A0A8S3S518_MYTED|nr:unnamed protein product [Mytilus edulis]